MDDSAPAPRVNGELLGNFIGKKVLLVGEVTPVDGVKATLKTGDDKMITVNLSGDGSFASKFVEFEGSVDSADTITESSRAEFGNDFDMYTYNELTKQISGKSRDLFY
jgi:replication factor A3|mmetsp:Transcript_4339/g.14208  ORF Transcript_4339/g.14208 Transcript_4339/m.14208 type:complete len:108 (+) Transcript_4339:47-370(+)